MKILHVLDVSLPHRQSGYSIRSKYIVETQKALGAEPVVFTRYGGLADEVELMDGISYWRHETEDTWREMCEKLGGFHLPDTRHFMKIAPVWNELMKYSDLFAPVLVHTGQHYDDQMSRVFIRDLNLPEPHYQLEVGSGSHAVQTAKVMIAFEEVLLVEKPDLVVVVGDVNSTVACALDAAKLQIPIAHIEAGLRSWDRSMPEETNRLMTDAISDNLMAPSQDARENLRREGMGDKRIHFVGNVMIDSLRLLEPEADRSDVLQRFNVRVKDYVFLTLHRASNVDCSRTLSGILTAIDRIQKEVQIVWSLHPRTENRLNQFGFFEHLARMKHIKVVAPVAYLDSLKLQKNAKMVLTDSGGVQEETTALGVPCLTLRNNTERPVTVEVGTNSLVGIVPKRIVEKAESVLRGHYKIGGLPELWDGKASERIVSVLAPN